MSAVDMFWAAPPIARTITAAALTLSIAAHGGFLSAYWLVFLPETFLQLPPQLWRLATSFCLTGRGFGILYDPYFLYTYGSKLETTSPRFTQPGDFFFYVLFVCGTVMGLNALLTGGVVYTSALILAFTYTSTQDDRGQKASFFIVTVPAAWIPYLMLVMTFVTEGPYAAKIQATGLIAAHLHDFLSRLWPTFGGGRNLLPTPGFIRRIWQTTEATVKDRSYGTAFAPAQRQAGTSGSSGVLPESWRSRGSGHRLGGD